LVGDRALRALVAGMPAARWRLCCLGLFRATRSAVGVPYPVPMVPLSRWWVGWWGGLRQGLGV